MIGRLSGRIDYRASDHVLLDVGGVGYVVFVSERTLAALPGTGEVVSLYTDLLVREDLLQLFGFMTPVEREWHRLLMGVQGIGARASMAILGTLGPEAVARAIALGDWASIRAAPGVGPKIAQRVVNELKGRVPEMMVMQGIARPEKDAGADVGPVAGPAPGAAWQAEALSALQNLGYAPGEASTAVAEAAGMTEDADTATLIREALKRLAPKA
ncbi:MAG: Holliday junction branch migration protein RuvA [Boseongicola sp. SB0676_bin_33]|nr:Holliday junction branch migration protein RuvA [Boseongicola sp. SB0676_bin_33]MYK32355.1 Holliday junction branch migration protein RuvA [Boseongicola sp. SB0670_bin_30]